MPDVRRHRHGGLVGMRGVLVSRAVVLPPAEARRGTGDDAWAIQEDQGAGRRGTGTKTYSRCDKSWEYLFQAWSGMTR